jgi:hypothetical protein
VHTDSTSILSFHNTPKQQSVFANTVYKVLKNNGYGVFKKTVKPGLKEEDKAA